MPPKKGAKAPEPAPIVPVDGAKFCYVVCGGKDSELKITVNTNCRTDILIDYIRQEFLRLAAVRTLELKALAALPDTPPSNAEMLQKWSELQTILSNTVFNTIDLNDEAGACLNCKTVSFIFHKFWNFCLL